MEIENNYGLISVAGRFNKLVMINNESDDLYITGERNTVKVITPNGLNDEAMMVVNELNNYDVV